MNCAITAVSRRPGRSSYEDLEPYYTQAEHLYLVHGRHGEDPREGPVSAQYAYPPVEHEPRIQQLSDDLEKLGLRPFHLPIGVNLSQDGSGRATHTSVCIRCNRVDGFPCLVRAKSDAQVICVEPALAHHNVEMITNTHVVRLETDPTGRSVNAVVGRLTDGSDSPFRGGRRGRLLLARSTRRPCCSARPTTATPQGWRTAPTSSAASTCGTTTLL